MDNYFNIYKTHLRHAEYTDTRSAIQRQQKEQDRNRSRDEHSSKEQGIFADDKVNVSIDALIALLDDLVVQASSNAQKNKDQEELNQDDNKTKSKGEDSQSDHMDLTSQPYNEQAAMAYKHAAQTKDKNSAFSQNTNKQAQATQKAIPADKIDVPRIQQLLDKARELQKKGLKDIEFSDTGDFLVNIEKTIAAKL